MIYDNDRIVFHVDVNSAYLSWTAVKLINNTEKIFEIKYDVDKCKWMLFKI
ncbi:hypothetical protein [Clostridium butyricum]